MRKKGASSVSIFKPEARCFLSPGHAKAAMAAMAAMAGRNKIGELSAVLRNDKHKFFLHGSIGLSQHKPLLVSKSFCASYDFTFNFSHLTGLMREPIQDLMCNGIFEINRINKSGKARNTMEKPLDYV